MSTSEKRNTLRRLSHFNFGGICDRSAVSLTPSGDPQPISCSPPKTQERQREGLEVAGWGGDTFD